MTNPATVDVGSTAKIIVCDLGATKIRVGTTHGDGSRFRQHPTPQDRDDILSCIENLVEYQRALYSPAPRQLVVGCPGLIDETGFVHHALYVNLSGTDLKSELEDRLKLKVVVVNDAKLQASGLLDEFESFVFFSLGSGVGGATALDRKLVYGAKGFAGELGHFALPGISLLCKCGKVGCLDTLAGGISIASRHGESWWTLQGSSLRTQALHDAGTACGLAAATLIQILNPSLLVFCGHIAKEVDFMSAIHSQLRAEVWGDLPEVKSCWDAWSLALRGARHVLNRTGDDA